jgi:hypothetical protein
VPLPPLARQWDIINFLQSLSGSGRLPLQAYAGRLPLPAYAGRLPLPPRLRGRGISKSIFAPAAAGRTPGAAAAELDLGGALRGLVGTLAAAGAAGSASAEPEMTYAAVC